MGKFSVTIDNSELVIQSAYAQIEKALKSVALTAEKYAKRDCPVDRTVAIIDNSRNG